LGATSDGKTKSDEDRTLYLDEELQEIFEHQRLSKKISKNPLPYVFLTNTGTDRIRRFDNAWKKACKDADIGLTFFHDLRRTAVRDMVRAGVPERVAISQEEYHRSPAGTISGTIAKNEDLENPTIQ